MLPSAVRRFLSALALLLLLTSFPSTPLSACDVPVFRWALEHWGAKSPDECYEVKVFHRGPLDAPSQATVDALRKRAWPGALDGGAEAGAETEAEAGTDARGNAEPEAGASNLKETTAGKGAEGQTAEEKDAVSPATALKDAASRAPAANFVVRDLDIDALSTEDIEAGEKRLWESQSEGKVPWIVASFPEVSRIPVPAWSGPLTEATAKGIVDSPLRQRIAERILKGAAAVWVLVESGDASKNAAARQLLEKHLKELERTLEIPQALDPTGGWQYFDADPEKQPLPKAELEPAKAIRPSFGLETVSRENSQESFLVRLLLKSEPDLEEVSAREPVAFPIFGRGRLLYALVGKGITEENVEEACGYIIGQCSCEFKWMNPGLDLIVAADWESVPATPTISAAQLLNLVAPPASPQGEVGYSQDAKGAPASTEATETLSPAAGAAAEAKVSAGQSSAAAGSGLPPRNASEEDAVVGRGRLLRNIGLTIGTLVLIVGASALALRKRLSRF